jgi:hypothetical protein
VISSAPVQVADASGPAGVAAVKPVTVAELTGPNRAYETYAARDLAALSARWARSGPP